MTFMQFHIHSAVLQMGMDVWALLPDHPEKLQKPMKVLWLLHGGSGDQTAWLWMNCREKRESIKK